MGKLFVLTILIVMGFSSEAAADVLYLKDGSTIEGDVIQESPERVDVRFNYGTATFSRSELKEIERSTKGPAHHLGSLVTQSKRALSKLWWKIKNRVTGWYREAKKTYAQMMKPVERHPAVKRQEKMVEENLKQMEVSLKNMHKTEKASFERQRESAQGGY